MITEIQTILECLVDELRYSEQEPSELTIEVLSRYEDKFDFIKDYFKELDEKMGGE